MIVEEYCCDHMKFWSEPGRDQVIYHTSRLGMPGIRDFNKGDSFVVIVFCPWCGKQVFDKPKLGGIHVRELKSTRSN